MKINSIPHQFNTGFTSRNKITSFVLMPETVSARKSLEQLVVNKQNAFKKGLNTAQNRLLEPGVLFPSLNNKVNVSELHSISPKNETIHFRILDDGKSFIEVFSPIRDKSGALGSKKTQITFFNNRAEISTTLPGKAQATMPASKRNEVLGLNKIIKKYIKELLSSKNVRF